MSVSVLDILGYYGPTIMVVANIWEFRYRLFHVGLFIMYILFAILVTKQLKGLIREPRPAQINNEWMHSMEYTGVEQYGMPSGHSTLMFFSLFYLWWNTKNTWYMIGGLFLAALTLYQRFKFKKHTISQLLVGAVLGFTLSYIAYMTTTTWFSKMSHTQNLPTVYNKPQKTK